MLCIRTLDHLVVLKLEETPLTVTRLRIRSITWLCELQHKAVPRVSIELEKDTGRFEARLLFDNFLNFLSLLRALHILFNTSIYLFSFPIIVAICVVSFNPTILIGLIVSVAAFIPVVGALIRAAAAL